MERSRKSIEHLKDKILPKQPHYLSVSPTRTYRIPPDERRFDEQECANLSYLSFIGGEADRGVLFTRAYYNVREEPKSNAPTPMALKFDPNKPRKKVSLKDYKNKKIEGGTPPKLEEREKSNGLSTIKKEEEPKKQVQPITKEMDIFIRDVKNTKANAKEEATRQHSPPLDRKKRPGEVEEAPKSSKRIKLEDATPNGVSSRPPIFAKTVRGAPPGRTEVKDKRNSIAANGKPAPSSSAPRMASPRQTAQVNGHAKSSASAQPMHNRSMSNGEPTSKVLPLLSPLDRAITDLCNNMPPDVLKEGTLQSRPSPRKRPADTNSLKPLPKKMRNDREPSPGAKKRRAVPPLLSPTLPPLVMDELARLETTTLTSSKETSQRSSQTSDSSVIARPPVKSTTRDEVIPINKKEEPTQYLAVMKYKKRHAKTIERLLNLPSGGKKKLDSLRKDERTSRENGNSIEPGPARKRPPTTTDVSEAVKRPKTSDGLKPSTPPRQSIGMSRMASNSSQVGTPGAANGLTPSSQLPAERRREQNPVPPDRVRKAQRLYQFHRYFMELGTKLKHQRDAIMKSSPTAIQERDHQTAMAAGIQSLLLYMHAVKLQSDAYDLERLPRRPQAWREVLPLFRVMKIDCTKNSQLVALLLRIHAICLNYLGKSFWFLPNELDAVLATSKEECEVWRQADTARRSLGTYDGRPDSSDDGGPVGKLIDQLGPWTTPEEAIRITLAVLHQVFGLDGFFKPVDDLVKISAAVVANGVSR